MISAGVNITKKLLSALEFDNYKKITYNQVLFFIVTTFQKPQIACEFC